MILMLRAIWRLPLITYQLLEIPVDLLRLIRTAELVTVGRRAGRRSLGADVFSEGDVAFHVHFDAADGKCQIRNLSVNRCALIDTWEMLAQD